MVLCFYLSESLESRDISLNSDIGIQKGLSVPDSSLLVLLAEEFDTSVSTLLGETMHEESLNEGSLKNISEKLPPGRFTLQAR